MSETAHYASATCLALIGAVLFGMTYRTNRFDRASDIWAVLRAIVLWMVFVAAFILFTTAPPYPLDDVPWLVGGVVYVTIFVVGGQLWLLSTTRRGAVESWASGAELPAGVSEAGVREWAARHRLELGAARAPVDITSGERTLRIEIPSRRSRRSWMVGLPALAAGMLVSVAIVGFTFCISFGSLRNFPVSLFVFVVSMIIVVIFVRHTPLLAVTLYGAHSLFGWLVVEVGDDRITVRRRVWRLRNPPFIEIRDASRAVSSIVVGADSSERALIHIRWREQRVQLTDRSAVFGAGYLSPTQAHTVVAQMLEGVGLE